jgi:hypothetical protein
MCRASSSSTRSTRRSSSSQSSSSSSPAAWRSYFIEECLQRGVEPDELGGGELGNWLRRNAGSLPPLRLRERAWMQLLAQDPEPEALQPYTVAAERVDLQVNDKEVVQEIEAPALEFDWRSW